MLNQPEEPSSALGVIGDDYYPHCHDIQCRYIDADSMHCPVLKYFQQGLWPRLIFDEKGQPILDETGQQALFQPTVELSLVETNEKYKDIPEGCPWDLSKA